MDNQQKLNDLFRKAKEQEPVTSFDQTKEHFLNSHGNQTIKTKDASVFNYKKWIIMLSSIISIVGITLFFTSSNSGDSKVEKEKQTITHSKTISNRLNSKQLINQNESNPISEPHNSEIISNLINNQPFYLKNEMGRLPSFDLRNILQKHYQNIPFDDTLKTGSITIPILSEKEIKANNKQKEKMLKDLINLNENQYAYIPSGSFKFDGEEISVQAFQIQTTEVSNLEYRTFLFDLLIQDKKDDFLKALPLNQNIKTKVIDGESKKLKPSDNLYFSHQYYKDYPVCNISREGAEMYCIWLTQEVIKINIPKNKFKSFNAIRIPTQVEWVYAASSRGKQYPYAWDGEFIRNSKGLFLANHTAFNYKIDHPGFEQPGYHTIKGKLLAPNSLGLYNLCGNVAEMVEYIEILNNDGKKSISKVEIGTAGGGWMDNEEEVKILAIDKYYGLKEANPNIGFRVVFTHLNK